MKMFKALLLVLAFTVVTSLAYAPANVAGKWAIMVDAGGQQVEVDFNLTQKDDTFTGTTSSQLGDGTIEQGKVTDASFTAIMKTTLQGTPVDIKLSGKVDGEKISGSMDVPSFGVLPFSGSKIKS